MRRKTFPLLYIMAYFGNPWWQPSSAQSSAMTLLSLAPPVAQTAAATDSPSSDATTTTAASAASSTVAPSVLYPDGNPTINNIDTVLVSYISPWDSVDLTVECERGSSKQSYDVNSLQQSGNYNLSPIVGSLDFATYPQTCSMILHDASNTADVISGGTFTMTNTKGSPSVYALTATQAAVLGAGHVTTTAATATSTTESLQSGQSSTQPGATATTGIAASAATSSSSKSSESSTSHHGLSGGAKAGIAFTVIIILALFALAAFFFLRQRRQLQRTEAALATEKQARETEKAYIDNILKAAGKPDTASGGRIVVSDIGSRNGGEGDWKSFFASKANSAKNSAREMTGAVIERVKSSSRPGSRRFSRMSFSSKGSRRNSRPGTAANGGEDDVPSVPSLPAMSHSGSTTNLVRNAG